MTFEVAQLDQAPKRRIMLVEFYQGIPKVVSMVEGVYGRLDLQIIQGDAKRLAATLQRVSTSGIFDKDLSHGPRDRAEMTALTEGQAPVTPKVLMVFPRFNQNSFWSFRAACDFYGARSPAPPLGLMTLAALLPREWSIRLVDRNAEALEPAALDWADMVMTGGMLPQRKDALEVIELCRAHGKPVSTSSVSSTR